MTTSNKAYGLLADIWSGLPVDERSPLFQQLGVAGWRINRTLTLEGEAKLREGARLGQAPIPITCKRCDQRVTISSPGGDPTKVLSQGLAQQGFKTDVCQHDQADRPERFMCPGVRDALAEWSEAVA